jgi:hypothetical protein
VGDLACVLALAKKNTKLFKRGAGLIAGWIITHTAFRTPIAAEGLAEMVFFRDVKRSPRSRTNRL